ncbi:alpha/beta hydrolase [Roseivirga sp. BDSF3-8]|uniref:alpha/beta hydrolase n=1 Tax=Roseivirga sp. BDSF3-8 TaxID=3241598 RepID=UPI00353217C5
MTHFFLRLILISCLLSGISHFSVAQTDTTLWAATKYTIESAYADTDRDFWVSLPMQYDTAKAYPVMYVLDAEWRFNLVRNIVWDLAGNKKIPHHIVVGIPHVEWENQRGRDLTFSQSRMEYDGTPVDSTWYNATNSGDADAFYHYLTEEVVPMVDEHYATDGRRILIGHSLGGYFGGYILPFDGTFSHYQIYDPSMWYSAGEVNNQIEKLNRPLKKANVFVSFQSVPPYHRQKIIDFITLLKKEEDIDLNYREYTNETHNSLYMYSVLEGMLHAYPEGQ